MAEVKPRPGNSDLGKAKGAFVVALALAKNVKNFDSMVCGRLNDIGFDVLKISDIEPLWVKVKKNVAAKKLLVKANALSKKEPVYIGTFHTFRKT